MNEVIDKIRSRGHWDVSIRPEPYIQDRVAYETLDDLLLKAVVRRRGWPVPYVHLGEYERGEHWIGADVDAGTVDHYEAWRFFQSGQFNQLRAFSADWESSEARTRVPEGFAAVIQVWEILYYLTELFELAARLSLTEAGDDQMTISARLVGLKDRGLVMGYSHFRRVGFMQPYRAHAPELTRSESVARDRLVGETRELAVEWSHHFFVRFGWKPHLELLRELQQDLDG